MAKIITVKTREFPDYYKEIKDDFESEVIWSRGSGYVSKVKNAKFLDPDEFTAMVEGSPQYGGASLYRVRVCRDEDNFFFGECSCPYNNHGDGQYCKHISGLVRYMANNKIEFQDDNFFGEEEIDYTDFHQHPVFKTLEPLKKLPQHLNLPHQIIINIVQNQFLKTKESSNPKLFGIMHNFLSRYDPELTGPSQTFQPINENQIKLDKLKEILSGQKPKILQNPESQFYIVFNIEHAYGGRLEINALKVNKKTQKHTSIELRGCYSRFQNGNCDYMTQDDWDFVDKNMTSRASYYTNSPSVDTEVNPKILAKLIKEFYDNGKLMLFGKKIAYYQGVKVIPEIKANSKKELRVRPIYDLGGDKGTKAVRDTGTILIGRESPYYVIDKGMSEIYSLTNQEKEEDLRFILTSNFQIDEIEASNLAKIADETKIILPNKIKIKTIKVDSITPQIYLTEIDGLLNFEIAFIYLYQVVMASSEETRLEIKKEDQEFFVQRDKELEKKHFEFLNEIINKNFASNFTLTPINSIGGEEAIFFVTEVIEALVDTTWQVFGQDKLKTNNFKKPFPKLQLESGIDWMSLEAEIDFVSQIIDLEEIAKLIRKGKRFVELKNGEKGLLPQDWIQKHKELFELGEFKNGKLQVSKWHLSLLESFAEVNDTVKNKKEWKTKIKTFFDFEEIKSLPKPNVEAKLRDYQQSGYEWLEFLYSNRMGGILADDMGLGKTLQTIAFLNKLYNSKSNNIAKTKKNYVLNNEEIQKQVRNNKGVETTILIVPKTLIYNWQIELKKFAPKLTYTVMHGSDRETELWSSIKTNLIITTYHTALKDVQEIKKRTWQCVILDESQQIKNPESLIFKAIRTIPSHHRLALSGTPVENNLEDLWSQISFLNPGMLGSRDWFRSNFVIPIQKNKDQEKSEKLKKMVYPFILRRLKQDVAKELGDKVEQTLYVEMDQKQKSMYDKIRLLFKKQIEEDFENSTAKAKFKVLEGLTKLRQICCHPALLDTTTKIESAKMELMLQTLDDIVAEGHKVLIFSQFTSMLALIKPELEKRAIKYSYLDGKTNKRQEEVDYFNNSDENKVFLISLKAGGVGLNLTSADYVFIYDPWWNPAVESQAVDRSHRIGQKNTVFVYRFVVKDSVEEKILTLQESKRELVKNIITVDESIMKKMDKSDIENLFG
jgi:SNF2 family DNA or RNA helicase